MTNTVWLPFPYPLLIFLLLTPSSSRILGNRRTTSTEIPTLIEISTLICAADCAHALEIADILDPCWEYTDQDAIRRGEVDCLVECQETSCANVGGTCINPETCGVSPEAAGWDEAEEAVTDGEDEYEEENEEDADAAYILYDDDWNDEVVSTTNGEDEGKSESVMNTVVDDDFYDDEYW